MIPAKLSNIEWQHIEALRDSGREEDDTLEYKASFSGGSDFLAFNDTKKAKAIEGIAREVVAFLNGRGGDVVIGVKEAENDHPKIEAITPIANVDQTVDRLAQSLSASIEPAQSIISIRAVRSPAEDGSGVLIVRCPSSLRAPHRFSPSKDCYIRRGRSSVPMPMDEIQDLTIRRTEALEERRKLLNAQFASMSEQIVGRHTLDAHRVHFRLCYVPMTQQQVELTEIILDAYRGSDPLLTLGGQSERLDVAFRNLDHGYRPILRGQVRESLVTRASETAFFYCAKSILADLTMRADFACRISLRDTELSSPGFHAEWISGFLANALFSFAAVLRQFPGSSSGYLRLAIYSAGPITISMGNRMWGSQSEWPSGLVAIPDFEIQNVDGLLGCLKQLQVDIGSIAGVQNFPVYDLAEQR